jgi:hypothetical protein
VGRRRGLAAFRGLVSVESVGMGRCLAFLDDGMRPGVERRIPAPGLRLSPAVDCERMCSLL